MTNYSPTILYIDDESDQRIFLGALLEYRGFRVRTVRRGLDALELMVTERFDAVIVDYDLPDMTGTQLAQEIRAFEPSARVILFSGRAHLTAGELKYVDVHIVNGSLLENIIETIRGLLELPAGPDLISTLQLDRQRGATKNKLKQANEEQTQAGQRSERSQRRVGSGPFTC